MALTVNVQSLQKDQIQGSPFGTTIFTQVAKLVFDTSYPSGGYPVTPSAFNLQGILGMLQLGSSGTATATFLYDANAGTIRAYQYPVTATSPATYTVLVEYGVGASLNGVSNTWWAIGY
jgi:hypothetical protein